MSGDKYCIVNRVWRRCVPCPVALEPGVSVCGSITVPQCQRQIPVHSIYNSIDSAAGFGVMQRGALQDAVSNNRGHRGNTEY